MENDFVWLFLVGLVVINDVSLYWLQLEVVAVPKPNQLEVVAGFTWTGFLLLKSLGMG